MATTATSSEVRIRKRRIVERPRLFGLLDDSKARVRMLIAPAGYGKTTLAEQWVARDGAGGRGSRRVRRPRTSPRSRSGSRRARPPSSRTATSGSATHMRALPAAAENVQTLAEILGEDLGEWPTRRVARHRRLPRGRAGTPSRGLRRRARLCLAGSVPHRHTRAPVVGHDEASALRRGARGQPVSPRDGQSRSSRRSRRAQRGLRVGPRRSRATAGRPSSDSRARRPPRSKTAPSRSRSLSIGSSRTRCSAPSAPKSTGA